MTKGIVRELKNRSEKCEGPGGGGRHDKEMEWEMRRTGAAGGIVRELKNRSEKCEGPGGGGGVDRVKNQSEKCEGPGRRGGPRVV